MTGLRTPRHCGGSAVAGAIASTARAASIAQSPDRVGCILSPRSSATMAAQQELRPGAGSRLKKAAELLAEHEIVGRDACRAEQHEREIGIAAVDIAVDDRHRAADAAGAWVAVDVHPEPAFG